MPARKSRFPPAAQQLLVQCFDEGRTAEFTARLIREETGIQVSDRTIARRLRDLNPDEEVRLFLGIFVDVLVQKLRNWKAPRGKAGNDEELRARVIDPKVCSLGM